MDLITLAHATDLSGWRQAARQPVHQRIAPEHVHWQIQNQKQLSLEALMQGQLLIDEQTRATEPPDEETGRRTLTVPRAFLPLCEQVILHSDPQRFALLYRILWRLCGPHPEPGLLQATMDVDIHYAHQCIKAVGRDIHKMRAFVRFREVSADEGALYVAWFEPEHRIAEANAPFFINRFHNMRWSILTPEVSLHWDGPFHGRLRTGPGAQRSDGPPDDAHEDLWLTYYKNIFNPARLKVSAMQSEMPRKYWHNLPEARLIQPLIQQARQRTQQMIDQPGTESRVS